MAEAHSAVAFSFAVSHEGVHINVNHDALWAVWESGVRSWKKKIGHVKVSAKHPSLRFEYISFFLSDIQKIMLLTL